MTTTPSSARILASIYENRRRLTIHISASSTGRSKNSATNLNLRRNTLLKLNLVVDFAIIFKEEFLAVLFKFGQL
jgi:hypothetical protein